MRRILPLILATLALSALLAAAPPDTLSSRLRQAVALLYSQDESGSLQMRCTATAFEKHGGTYLFASAAHCVGSDRSERAADPSTTPFYITFDDAGEKTFFRAQAKMVGYQHKGDDFATFEVASKQTWPTIPLGDEKKVDVEDRASAALLNVAAPLGLGKQMFRGFVSNVFLDRPIIQDDINWSGTMLLQISSGPGSSGSALVSEAQEAIVGFLVGTVGGSNVIGIPVSRFKAFRKASEAGTYKYAWDREATR